MSALTLKVVSPDGLNRTVECDGVILWMAPDRSGKGEGSIGIRKDHVNAVIALGSGKIEAHLDRSGQTEEVLTVLAREELAENGNWCSYQRDNQPDISL